MTVKNFCNSIKMQIFFDSLARCSWLQFLAVFIFVFVFSIYILYFLNFCESVVVVVVVIIVIIFIVVIAKACCDSFVKVMTNCERFEAAFFMGQSLYSFG